VTKNIEQYTADTILVYLSSALGSAGAIGNISLLFVADEAVRNRFHLVRHYATTRRLL
jgi:hypothetical protein